jgi:hypothetical protein
MAASKTLSRAVAGLTLVAGLVAASLPATANAAVNADNKFAEPLELSPLGEIVKIVLGPKH